MSYQGLLPRRVNINEMLTAKVREDTIRKQGFRLENDVRIEIKRDAGKGNTEIVAESLNEFAKMDEMDGWLENLSEAMVRQEERQAETKTETKKR